MTTENQSETLTHFLWYENPITQGKTACNKFIRRQQEMVFSQRFRKRIARLEQAYDAVEGPDESLEVIPQGRCIESSRDSEKILAISMGNFDIALKKWERKYGLAK